MHARTLRIVHALAKRHLLSLREQASQPRDSLCGIGGSSRRVKNYDDLPGGFLAEEP